MNIIIVTPQNTMFKRTIPEEDMLHSLQSAVGGYIETVPSILQNPYIVLCNEDGYALNLPINATGCKLYGTDVYGHPVLGNIIILEQGIVNGEPDFTGPDDSRCEAMMDYIWTLMGGAVEQITDPDADNI